MAKFIKLTDVVNNVPVSINIDHIVAFGRENKDSTQTTVLINYEGAPSLDVVETPEQISNALEIFNV